jgi:hypothetical protein
VFFFLSVVLFCFVKRIASDMEAKRRQDRIEQERVRDDDAHDHVL